MFTPTLATLGYVLSPDRKNVLLIVVDQWRGDLLPKLGAPNSWPRVLRTPNIDALCEAGVTFRNHLTQAAPCGPGRASGPIRRSGAPSPPAARSANAAGSARPS